MKALLLSYMVLSSAAVVAADTETYKVEGKVGELQAVADGATAWRVTLEKAPPLCGNAWTYTYIGEEDDGFKGMVELVSLAKRSKAQVMLVSERSRDGHCKLISVTVR